MNRTILLALAIITAASILISAREPADAATFTVNVNSDAADINIADAICDSSATAGVQCSLRAAIQEANDTAGFDTINFGIGSGQVTITLGTTALPAITGGVLIDGTSQPGYNAGNPTPMIEVLGTNVAPAGFGLQVTTTTASTIKGLALTDHGQAIRLEAGSGHTVQGNYVGLRLDGSTAMGNLSPAIAILSAASGTFIGGDTAAERNVISGNDNAAISTLAGGTTITGNYIGTDSSGTLDRGNGADAIWLQSGSASSTVGGAGPLGNVISGNTGAGIRISGDSNTVRGNLIGLAANGAAALANTGNGITVENGADNNTIGGTAAGEGNVISGNAADGILTHATGTAVQGNLIGTDITGVAGIGNGGSGVHLSAGVGNTIGGTSAAARNVISGHDNAGKAGIRLDSVSDANFVLGNYIGTDAAGTASLPNNDGIGIYDSDNNEIGGTVAGSGNVIAGNLDDGIEIASNSTATTVEANYIGIDATGATDLGNGANGIQQYGGANNTVIGGGGASRRNVISGNIGTAGILLVGVSSNTVSGNYIGLNAAGDTALGNNTGVEMSGTGNTIGGQAAGDGNAISGNLGNGIEISGANNSVLANIIGLNAAGTADLGNAGSGVLVTASNNTVGGSVTPGDGNVISGNDVHGIEITDADTTGTIIEANYIGADITGALDRGNTLDGIHIDASDANTIGGTSAAARNVISGNNSDGVELANDANTNTVKMNYIGTDATGMLDRGNSGIGVNIVSSDGNIVGGANAGNVSSGNNADGVEISTGSVGNWVQANNLGVAADGASVLGNGTNGIQILGASSGTFVGGDTAAVMNHMAYNGGDGITVSSGTGNLLARNSIHDNSALGIDLANDNIVTPNDTDDPDAGANNLQNWPVLTSAASTTATTNIIGSLNSTPSTTFTLRVFYSASCDASGNGEGATYLVATNVTTDAGGDVSFNTNLAAAAPGMSWLTATVTAPGNNTSEFSNCVQVPALVVDNTSDSNLTACTTAAGDCSLRGAINNANAASDLDQIHFSVGAGGAQTIAPASALPVITAPVVIDATTQPGFAGAPLIVLNGTGAGVSVDGLNITGGGSTVRGLIINSFGGNGIVLQTSGGNVIEGNYIGTNASGSAALANGSDGIVVDSANNTIGGTTAAARNLVSGNGDEGIAVGGTGNLIAGNYIGTYATGASALGNGGHGIQLSGGSNIVGGSTSGQRNVIAANARSGIHVGAGDTTIIGNYIGTNAAGAADLGNTEQGIWLSAGTATVIGGTTAGARNIISGNETGGIAVGAASTEILGNYIGTNATGTAALGNTGDGITVTTSNNTIGSTTPGSRNVISGNSGDGVEISGATTTGNQVLGNYIGTDLTGAVDLGNNGSGVSLISDAHDNTIGGISASARNVISGNNAWGITIGSGADNNTVSGNFIGTNAAGAAALGNSSGMSLAGFAAGNIIGGAAPGAGNVISGNNFLGITIGNGAGTTTIAGNYIGTDLGATLDLGNGSEGISIIGASANNAIGDTGSSAPNVIAFNGDAGLRLGAAGTGNRIGANKISGNAGLGVDLGPDGVTPNDLGDPDTGPNNLQNFPVIILASEAPSSQTIVRGYLNSAPSTSYTVNFFRNASCDASGNGEGETSIELAGITTDAFGFAQFALFLDSASTPGQFITATATDPAGNTSEFSACRTVTTDFDGDADADSADNCPAWSNPTQALPAWTVASNDADCDGFSTADEAYIGTNPSDQCGAGAWPPDFNDSGGISVTDVLAIKPVFGESVPPASARFDIKVSGTISVSDVLALKPYFAENCS